MASDLLRALGKPFEIIIDLDFETYWDKDYKLRSMTTESYVRDPRFETIGVGVKWPGQPSVWLEDWDFREWAARVDWSRVAVTAHHCVPGDTEVLTRGGWAKIKAVPLGVEIMQWDPASGALSWVFPDGKTSDLAPRLLSWGTNHHRTSYTPQHRMYIATPDCPRWVAERAEIVAARHPNSIYIPTAGVFTPGQPIALTPDEARLMEAIRADSSWSISRAGACNGAQFNLGTNTAKPARLLALAGKLGLAVTGRSPRPGVTNLRLLVSETVRKLYALLGREKEYGLWVLNLSVECREAILDEARHWDGSQRRAAHSYLWACARPRTVEAFQLMAHATGWTFSGRWKDNQRGLSAHIPGCRIYIATVCKKARAKLVERATEQTFSVPQDVYCFTVQTGAFLVRSDDRVHVTGNCHFDGLILSHHYGIKPGFWLCTLSMGRVLHGTEVGGSLGALSQRYGVGVKGDEVMKTQGKRRADFTQREWLRFGDYCNNDVELTSKLRPLMARQLPREELWLIDSTVRMFTEPVFHGDQSVLAKAYDDERAKKARLLSAIGASREALSSADKFADLLRALDIEPPMKPNAKGKMIYAFAKSDPGMQALEEHGREDVRDLVEARLAVKSTIIETRTERVIGAAKRGAIPFYLRYSGAHTHRMSGGDKMNPQNFNRGGILRDAILAPPGRVIVVADSGQIEARVVAWLAGQGNLLETFRRNDALGEAGDFYSDEGSRYFGKKISKKETPLERQVAKNMCLGLSFGMGVFKFAGELLKGMLGAPPVQFGTPEAGRFNVDVDAFAARSYGNSSTCAAEVENMITFGARLPFDGLLIHCAVTDYFVRLYRANNGRIAGLWKAMGTVLETMVKPDGRMTFGPLKISHEAIEKPGGLKLLYPGLRRGKDGFSYMGGKGGRARTRIYGGLVTENVVQSLARDIVLAEQALWIRAAGYHIATTTHDEIVCVVPEARGAECLAFMLSRMRIPPAWCADLPLNASGGIGTSYGACK